MSPSRVLRASAPGKMMIAGEYAVLEGAEAIVAAALADTQLVLRTLTAHPGPDLEIRK